GLRARNACHIGRNGREVLSGHEIPRHRWLRHGDPGLHQLLHAVGAVSGLPGSRERVIEIRPNRTLGSGGGEHVTATAEFGELLLASCQLTGGGWGRRPAPGHRQHTAEQRNAEHPVAESSHHPSFDHRRYTNPNRITQTTSTKCQYSEAAPRTVKRVGVKSFARRER